LTSTTTPPSLTTPPPTTTLSTSSPPRSTSGSRSQPTYPLVSDRCIDVIEESHLALTDRRLPTLLASSFRHHQCFESSLRLFDKQQTTARPASWTTTSLMLRSIKPACFQ
jgi:hypothetical protein